MASHSNFPSASGESLLPCTIPTSRVLDEARCQEITSSSVVSGYSLWAQSLIFLVTLSWASVVDERFFAGDAAVYYRMLTDGSWSDSWSLEPVLFLVLGIVNPNTFSSYIFYSGTIALTVLLYAFYRLGYTRTEQILLILFFSCSYYGVHFLLDFQRQFYAFVFFMLAVSLHKGRVPAWIASLFSHAFSFSLLFFWSARKLPVKAALTAFAVAAPIIYYGTLLIVDPAKILYYGSIDEVQLLLKQPLNLLYAGIVIFTTREGENDVRTLAWLFIALSIPTMFWPVYSGVFVRFDYYFFPALIALWPTCLDPRRRRIFAAVILGSTVLGFALWIKMNLGDVVNAIEPR